MKAHTGTRRCTWLTAAVGIATVLSVVWVYTQQQQIMTKQQSDASMLASLKLDNLALHAKLGDAQAAALQQQHQGDWSREGAAPVLKNHPGGQTTDGAEASVTQSRADEDTVAPAAVAQVKYLVFPSGMRSGSSWFVDAFSSAGGHCAYEPYKWGTDLECDCTNKWHSCDLNQTAESECPPLAQPESTDTGSQSWWRRNCRQHCGFCDACLKIRDKETWTDFARRIWLAYPISGIKDFFEPGMEWSDNGDGKQMVDYLTPGTVYGDRFAALLRELDVFVVLLTRNNMVAQTISQLKVDQEQQFAVVNGLECRDYNLYTNKCQISTDQATRVSAKDVIQHAVHVLMHIDHQITFLKHYKLPYTEIVYEDAVLHINATIEKLCSKFDTFQGRCRRMFLAKKPYKPKSDAAYVRGLEKVLGGAKLLAELAAETSNPHYHQLAKCMGAHFHTAYPQSSCRHDPKFLQLKTKEIK